MSSTEILNRYFYDADFSTMQPQDRIPLRADKLEDYDGTLYGALSEEEISSMLRSTIQDYGILIHAFGQSLQPISPEDRKGIIQRINSDCERFVSVLSKTISGGDNLAALQEIQEKIAELAQTALVPEGEVGPEGYSYAQHPTYLLLGSRNDEPVAGTIYSDARALSELDPHEYPDRLDPACVLKQTATNASRLVAGLNLIDKQEDLALSQKIELKRQVNHIIMDCGRLKDISLKWFPDMGVVSQGKLTVSIDREVERLDVAVAEMKGWSERSYVV